MVISYRRGSADWPLGGETSSSLNALESDWIFPSRISFRTAAAVIDLVRLAIRMGVGRHEPSIILTVQKAVAMCQQGPPVLHHGQRPSVYGSCPHEGLHGLIKRRQLRNGRSRSASPGEKSIERISYDKRRNELFMPTNTVKAARKDQDSLSLG